MVTTTKHRYTPYILTIYDSSDVLDDMNHLSTHDNKTKVEEKKTVVDTKESEPSLDDLLDNNDFAKELSTGMEQLLGQLEKDDYMKDAFEKVWASLDDKSPQPKTQAPTREVPKPAESFQDAIGKTMNKLKDSSKEVDSSMAGESEEAFMAELMKQMESLADTGDFENVLEGMMGQLMSKELLYEPIKDLCAKYPVWLKDNKGKVEQAEYDNYAQQHKICQEIVAKYESPTFNENDEAQAKVIMDLMTKMQDLGQPPASLLDDMAPGMNFNNPESLPDLENCTIM
ncbi:Pex19 protein family-domain-containing protein [Pilobolus umbonatus]|nr:Pex19 protein family-domain-containing protein [Pilobolus umbonatus]